MDPITLIILVALGGICIGGGVHFIPVGGAPAAMATATGVGTGTAMLAAGAGMTGLITAAGMTGQPLWLILLAGAIGSMLMIGITMVIANVIYIYGVGISPASSKVDYDPITGLHQEPYKSPGTEGHGVPTSCFVSGIIGGLLGGLGGGLVYYALQQFISVNPNPDIAAASSAIAAIFAVSVFFINAVIASYNIGGTIEGFQDPKFKKIPFGIATCLIVSIVVGLFAIVLGGVI